MRKWILRVLLGLLAIVVLGVVSAVIFVHTDTGRAVIRDRLVDQLQDTFVGKVTIGRIDGSPFGTLTARDIVIDDAAGDPAIAIARVDVEVGVTGLVSKRLDLKRVVVDDVAVVVHRGPDGELSIAHLLKPTPPSTWHTIVRDLVVRHGRVTVTGVGAEVMHFDQLEVAGAVDYTAERMSIDGRISTRWRERGVPITATVVARGEGEAWSMPVVTADVDGAYVRAANVRVAGDQFGGSVVIHTSRASMARLANIETPDLELALEATPADGHTQIALVADLDRERVRADLALELGRARASQTFAGRVAGTIATSHLAIGRLAERAPAHGRSSTADLSVAGTAQLDVQFGSGRVAGALSTSQLAFAGLAQPELRDLVVGATATFDLALGEVVVGDSGQVPARRLPIGGVIAHATAAAHGLPATGATISVRSDGTHVRGSIDAVNAGANASISGELAIGKTVSVTEGHLLASSKDLGRATGGLAPVRGRLDIDLTAHGTVSPVADLAVAGRIDGTALRAADLSVGSVRVALDARRLPAHPTGRLDLRAADVQRGTMWLQELTVAAADRGDGKISASLRTRPKRAPWLVEADALIAPGREITTVDLTRHFVRASNGGEWAGNSGRLTIAPDRIALAGLRSASRTGAVAIDGSYQRTGANDLSAVVDATSIVLSTANPKLAGTAGGHLEIARRGGRFVGEARVEVHDLGVAVPAAGKVATSEQEPPKRQNAKGSSSEKADRVAGSSSGTEPSVSRSGDKTPSSENKPPVSRSGAKPSISSSKDKPPVWRFGDLAAKSSEPHHPAADHFDGRATIKIDGSKLDVAAEVGGAAGSAHLTTNVVGPTDITDLAAWRRLGASAISDATLELARVDLAKVVRVLGAPDAELAAYRGTIDGTIRVAAGIPSGHLRARGIVTPELRGMGAASADLDVTQSGDMIMPTLIAKLDTIGSLTAKAELRVPDRMFDPAAWDRNALRRATLSARDLAIDPGRLDMLRLYWTGRGRASFDVELLPHQATAAIALRDLRGSPVARPVDIDLHATIDREISATLTASSKGERLIEGNAAIPASLDALIANPRLLASAPITGTATAKAPAVVVLGVVGRTELEGGTIEGNARISGTLAAPQIAASITGSDLAVPPGPGNKPVQTVKSIVMNGSWRDRRLLVSVDATEERGTLHASVIANEDAPADAMVTVTAKSFDLVPVLAFAPGPAGGAAGRLDADLEIRGLDPHTAQIAGDLHLRDGRIPIAPAVGTMRRASVDAKVTGREVALAIEGTLGKGKVKGSGSIALDGASPTGGKLTLVLRKVSPIGVVEPVIDADVTVDLRHETDRWVAAVDVRNATVVVPSARNQALAPPGAPTDMVFASGRKITRRPLDRGAPARPAIVARISIAPTRVESEELRGMVRGNLTVSADGDAVGVFGVVEAERGDLDLFGRRYRVDRASVRFDGGVDPLLDISIIHEFPEVTTTTQIRGRASKPRLIMRSSPGTYSQGQLLGFLLGGEPSGDPGDSRDRASAAGTSYLANRLGGYVRGFLPIDLDVLRYEQATSMSSAAITVGTWIRHELFLAYRRRLDARPDENAGEGELEYWLARRIVIESVVGDRNRDSVDLLWRKRY